jgi:DNA-binding NtrC family response regulator/pSer/pThr/pTyr-binding forkhead associated (FHA) protein
MRLARLVVVDGPDVGAEFPLPPAGGTIGRGEGSAVQLSDLSVSRAHLAIETRGERHVLVDAGSRNRTLVNGKQVSEHPLVEGDEITVGKTRLVYLPPEGGVAVLPTSAHARVTLEIPTGELLRARATLAKSGILADRGGVRQLTILTRLGDGLRRAADRPLAARVSAEAFREALDADRAFIVLRDAAFRLSPMSSSSREGDAAGTQLALGRDVLDKVVREGKSLVLGAAAAGGRPALAAPLPAPEGGDAPGLLWADRGASVGRTDWDEGDLLLATCMAHLIGAALDGLAARESLVRQNRALEERLGSPQELIGESGPTRALLGFIGKVAPTDSTVLLLGESGAGKEMVASAIHRASRRAREPFVAVNCAALSETLLESELFGHEKGAFTGATEKKVGRFELADGGTLFLDEVGELSPRCQTKFLRVLEERRFERVGGTRPISVDVRVIAATNRNLEEMIRKAEFRDDLYYRLSVIQTDVPPLRARPDDIPSLAEHFLQRVRQQTGRRVAGFAPEALRALMAYPWPGNVRELRNAVERAVVLGEGDLVRVNDLPPAIAAAMPQGAMQPPTAPSAFVQRAPAPAVPMPPGMSPPTPIAALMGGAAPQYPRSLKELEKEGILAALAATRGNKAQAAAILEIDRSTLYKKLKEYGIEP